MGLTSWEAAGTAAALCLAAEACREAGDPRRAIDLAARAIELDPISPRAWVSAGLSLRALGREGEARGALRRAAHLDPALAEAYNGLGASLLQDRHPREAAVAFAQACRARPGWWVSQLNLGLAKQHQADHWAALPHLEEALRLAPGQAEAWNALGTARQSLGDAREAEAAYCQALDLRPDYAEACSNLGRTLRAQGRLAEAASFYERAIALRPGYAEARWNLALVKLLRGELEGGWQEFEWRWRVPGFPSRPRGFAQPLWSGEDIRGRRVLLHAEQGFGDTLQFLRYVPLIADRGAAVLLEVQPELLRLVQAAGFPAQVLAQGQELPEFDIHAPLLSLPRAFGTTLDSIPAPGPYLAVPDEALKRWRRRLPRDEGAPRVALVWAGRPTHSNDANRSVGLGPLAPLVRDSPCRFISLQVGPRTAEIAAEGLAERIEDLSPDLTDFVETAAALSSVDLLISVDTAVAHLAGALARPLCLLLPFAPDWRWLADQRDTPWYPTAQLLRQHRPGDWSRPLSELQAILAAPHSPQLP